MVTCIPLELTLNVNLGGAVTINHVRAPPPPQTPKVLLAVMVDGFTVTGEANTMDTDIPEGKRIKIEVLPQDVSGNPAPIDGNVAWVSDDPTLLQVVPDAASPSQAQAWVQNAVGGSLGPTHIHASIDADTGAGVTTVTVALSFNAVAGQAAGLGVEQIGAIEDIPAP